MGTGLWAAMVGSMVTVLFLISYFTPAEAAIVDREAIISTERLPDWTLFGGSSKKDVLADNSISSGIFSQYNNQRNTFLMDPRMKGDPTILEVKMIGMMGKGDTFSGTTKVYLIIEQGTRKLSTGKDNFLTSTPTDFTRVETTNPLTKKAWKLIDFSNTGFGVGQATDNKRSNVYEYKVSIRINDSVLPTITAPPNIVEDATSPSGRVINNLGAPTVNDDIDPNPVVTNSGVPAGNLFPVGTTEITWKVTDFAGNFATATQQITVRDVTPPTITAPPPITREATAQATPLADVQPLGTASATDDIDPNPVITNDAPDTFPLGQTTVTWKATDFSGNFATATQIVTLVDTTPPTLILPDDITKAALSPVPVSFTVTATDAVDPSPNIVCNPTSGSLFPVGKNIVNCTATDASGNSSEGSFIIHVFDVSSSANTVAVGSQFYIQVTDTGATGNSVIVRVASPPSHPTNFIDVTLAAAGPPGVFMNILNPVLPVLTLSDPPVAGEIFIPNDGFDRISITYSRAGESKTIEVGSSAPGNVFGRPVTASNPIGWSSDRFVIETSGFVKVFEGSFSGGSLATITAGVKSTSDTTVRDVTLVEDPANIGTFTSQYAITFTNTSPSDFSNPTIPRLYAPIGSTVTASYPSASTTNIATAIIDSPTIPTFGAILVPTTNISCGVGGDDDFDGICDTQETQSVSVVGIRIASGSGQVYTYGCRPLIDDTAGNPSGTPYSAHSASVGISPTSGSGSSGGYFVTTNGCPNPLIRDVYFEIDYMNGHKPTREALAQFIKALADMPDPDGAGPILPGIKAHIQLDENYGFHRDQIPFTSAAVDYDFESLKEAKFGKAAERSGKTGTALINYLGEKRQVFHYVASIHDIEGSVGRSGYGEIWGNDILISLGSFTANRGTDDEFAATLMHEAGHNWGLDHQGPSDLVPAPINCAPNYLSVMNYLYQFKDIVNDRPLAFSRSALPTLDQVAGMSEAVGLGQATPTTWRAAYGPVTGTAPFTGVLTTSALAGITNPVNWNRDADTTDTGVKLALHNVPALGCTDSTLRVLVGQNDEAGMKLNFRGGSNFGDGIHTSLDYNPDRSVQAGFVPSGDADHNAPFVKTITVPTVLAVNTALTLSGSIEDPGEPGETHTVTVNWGDGTSSTASLTYLAAEPEDETIRANINPLTHTYTSIGKYTISVTVTDSTGLSDTSAFPQFIIVHNMAGRLVSTSSVNTPAGAFKPDPSLTGVASFSLQPDWRNIPLSAPTGNFHFEFPAGSLVVDGTAYEWLYINGIEAHFQGVGTGTLGGVTKTFGITGSAIDGNLAGGNGIDKVRIRIFDPLLGGQFDPGALVYDNMCTDFLGSTTDATQPSPLCVKVFEPANDATITLGGTVGITP